MEVDLSPSDFIYENFNKLRDIYTLGKKIGDGRTSIVRLITHKVTQERRAVKIISKSLLKSPSQQQMFFNEISVLKQLDHPNIVQLCEFFQDSKNYYIITELCEGEELLDKIINEGCLSETESANYLRQNIFKIKGISHMLTSK